MSTQKLYAALIAAQREAATVPKDGKNDHFGFSYTKADTMYRCGKQILNNHGLALMPLGLELSSHEATGVVLVGNQRQVADLTEYDVTRDFLLVHELGESVEFSIQWPVDLAGGKKSRDKSVAAADTTLLSYAYRDLLALGRLGEGEVDALTPVADAKGAGTEPSPQDAKDLEAFIRERASAASPTEFFDKRKAEGERTSWRIAEVNAAERVVELERDLANAEALIENIKLEPEQRKVLKDAEAAGVVKDVRALRGEAITEDAAEREAIQDLAKEEEVEHAQEVLETVPLGADDLEARGWEPEIAEEIAAIDDSEPVARAVVNHLAKLCTFAHGIKGAPAKAHLVKGYAEVGVDIKIKQTPTGTQLKQWAMSALLPF